MIICIKVSRLESENGNAKTQKTQKRTRLLRSFKEARLLATEVDEVVVFAFPPWKQKES